MSSKLEPAIWSHVAQYGQQIPCFDRCQLTITWMSNNKEGCYINQGRMSLPTYKLEYAHHLVRLLHRCRRVHTPMSNTTSHDNHTLYGYGAPLACLLRAGARPLDTCSLDNIEYWICECLILLGWIHCNGRHIYVSGWKLQGFLHQESAWCALRSHK